MEKQSESNCPPASPSNSCELPEIRTASPESLEDTIYEASECFQREYRLDDLPEEVKLNILRCLHLKDLCKLNLLSQKWKKTAELYFSMLTEIDFESEDKISIVNTASQMTDTSLVTLLSKCPLLTAVRGFHPKAIVYENFDCTKDQLTTTGVVAAFTKLPRLKTVEISDIHLLTAVSSLPQVNIPVFRNRRGMDPAPALPCYQLVHMNVQELELFGVCLDHPPGRLEITTLHLESVWFKTGWTTDHPFNYPRLKSFMLKHCKFGESNTDDEDGDNLYDDTELFYGLTACSFLEVLHLSRAARTSRLIARLIELNMREVKPFSKLRKIVLSANLLLHEDDLGSLIISCQERLEILYIQATLTTDIFMLALRVARPALYALRKLKLGFVDELNIENDRPCQLSDTGLAIASSCFSPSNLESLSVIDCPYLSNPMKWIPQAGIDETMWDGIMDLTLQNCHAVNLHNFNKFIVLLESLRVLNLTSMFLAPPKGCSRVGLCAGMAIGGPAGIRPIVPHIHDRVRSLLSPPSRDVADIRLELNGRKLEESDDDDYMEYADTSLGYRCTQVHSSCSVDTQKIARSVVRRHQYSEEATLTVLNEQLNRRRSKRVRGVNPGENIDEDLEGEPLEDFARKKALINMIVDDIFSKRINQSINQPGTNKLGATGKSKPVKVKKIPEDSDYDSDEEFASIHCRHCGVLLDSNMASQASQALSIGKSRPRSFYRCRLKSYHHSLCIRASFRKLCKQCIKKRCDVRINKVAAVENLLPYNSARFPRVPEWLTFDCQTGLTLPRLLHPGLKRIGSSLPKGKLPLSMRADASTKQDLLKNEKWKKKNEEREWCRINYKRPSCQQDQPAAKAVKLEPVTFADKQTDTIDPYIEPDTVQVLNMEYVTDFLTCINLVNCGLTHVYLAGCTFLTAFTAHACPVLKRIEFASAPYISPKLVRITQCPKMQLPSLLETLNPRNISMEQLCVDPSPVRTIEFEPCCTEFVRDHALVELSSFSEMNKVLIQCHQRHAADQCPKMKTYYQSLLKAMSSPGYPAYPPITEYKIFPETEYKRSLIVCHNLPGCEVKITPYCSQPEDCPLSLSSSQGHELRGGTVFCFVYPQYHVPDSLP